MEVGKVTATGLVLVIFFGAGERLTAWGLDAAGHDSSGIAAEAGPLGGTILYEQQQGGYLALGIRQRVELSPRRPYRGGTIGDYL